MKNCYKLLVMCCLITSVCYAEEKESKNIPDISVMIKENIEKADTLLSELELELSRYLGGKNAYLKISEDLLKKSEFWQIALQRNKELQKKVIAERKKFLAFRENTAKIISLNFDLPAEDYFSSEAILEITKWYVNYMRKMLFPSHLPPEEQNES